MSLISVKRQLFSGCLTAGPSRHFHSLALGVALTSCLSAPVWAENFDLDSVDFDSSGDQTQIMLHTGSIVPVQKVLITNSKLILDIDQINMDGTIHTNFASAGNISHVIMQPVSEHKIRMIIRGENLGRPSVAFYDAQNGSYSHVNSHDASPPQSVENVIRNSKGENLDRDVNQALHQLQEEGMQTANLQSTENALAREKPISLQDQSRESIGTEKATPLPIDKTAPAFGEEEPISFGGIAPEKTENNRAIHHPDKLVPLTPLALQSSLKEEPGANNTTSFNLLNEIFKANSPIPYAIIGFLLLGIIGFIGYKIIQLKRQGEPHLDDLLEEQSQGKHVSFREMATAYRSKNDKASQNSPIVADPSARTPQRKSSAEDMIGLRSLNAPPLPSERNEKAEPALSLEQMIASIQAANAPKKTASAMPKTTPPQKQVVHQYLQTQNAKPKAGNRQASDEMTVKETKRAQDVQQELLRQAQQKGLLPPGSTPATAKPVNRAAAAQKTVKRPNFQTIPSGNSLSAKVGANVAQTNKQRQVAEKQGPLPGNPEVLNFLRNVAELMEKDGKPEIAKNIHKNLNPSRSV